MLQARPIGPIGAGYVLFMGISGAFIAVSTTAVASGGLAFNGAQRSIGSSIGGVRQPCDSPGAGCRNTVTPASPSVPANPPIVGGTRPGRRGVAE